MEEKTGKKRIKKIRPECADCVFLKGPKDPYKVYCDIGNDPTCYRKKNECKNKKLSKKNRKRSQKGESGTHKNETLSRNGTKEKQNKYDTPEYRGKAVAYTDGSYNATTRTFGTGVLMIFDGKETEYTDCGHNEYGGRQIQGEINGAVYACNEAIKAGFDEIEIRCDYEGVEKWATGSWRTNRTYTREYAQKMAELGKKIRIRFQHVRAHRGEKGNERADVLAKQACGLTSNEKTEKYIPTIPEGVMPECRDAIIHFYEKTNPTFRDYAELKTHGFDSCSSKSVSELQKYADRHGLPDFKKELGDEASPSDVNACIRWVMRGLTPSDAEKKVMTDMEIRHNAEEKKK